MVKRRRQSTSQPPPRTDATFAPSDDDFEELPEQRRYFAGALRNAKLPALAAKVGSSQRQVVAMPWKTDVIGFDSGLYMMRHMETFFGAKQKGWDCNLKTNPTRALSMLRIKYARTLLTCPFNALAELNVKAATRHWKESGVKGSFMEWVDSYGCN